MSEALEKFSSLLEADIDNIEDLPEFEEYPAGVYKFKCEGLKVEENTEKERGEIKGFFSLIEPVELANEADADNVPVAGSLLGGFWTDEKGIQRFKKIFVPVMQESGIRRIADFLPQAEGLEMILEVSRSEDKKGNVDAKGNPRIYNNIQSAILS